MTTINNMLMKFPGIFENKEVRIKDGYISVLDTIQTCSGCKKESTRKLWQRIKNEYNNIVTDCRVIKFDGKKQKETPCINMTGFVKLLMIIPGKLADKFRSDVAPIIIRNLGGDTSLINEIKYTDQLHIQNGESNIFRKVVKKKLCYDEKYYMYVRVFSPFFAEQQKDAKIDEKVRKLNWDMIKFGIAKYLDGRENSYSNDNGYFQFSIEVPSKECALFIEKISRNIFKDITVGNSFEYLDSKKLAKHFGIIKEISLQLEKRDYYLSAKELYTKMLIDLHMYYPEVKDNFGSMNHPKVEENENFETIISNSVIELSKEKLPNYVLKECQIIDQEKIEVEIKDLNNNNMTELNENEITFEEENKELKLKLSNFTKLVKKKAPEVLNEFNQDQIKAMEHKKKYKKNKVYQYSLDGKFIRDFESITAAANYYECSTKIIRISCQNKKALSGFLWRSSQEAEFKKDLPIRKIEKCDPDDYKVIKIYNTFEEINEELKNVPNFFINEIYRSIDLGLIYQSFRWKFENEELIIGKALGRIGRYKRIAKLNDKKELIQSFSSLDEALKHINLKTRGSLSTAANNGTKAGGFYWKYII